MVAQPEFCLQVHTLTVDIQPVLHKHTYWTSEELSGCMRGYTNRENLISVPFTLRKRLFGVCPSAKVVFVSHSVAVIVIVMSASANLRVLFTSKLQCFECLTMLLVGCHLSSLSPKGSHPEHMGEYSSGWAIDVKFIGGETLLENLNN